MAPAVVPAVPPAVPPAVVETEAEGQDEEPIETAHATAAVATAAVATAAATAPQKDKKWRCSACGKFHAAFATVQLLGGGYVCRENCGIVQGTRERKRRPAA